MCGHCTIGAVTVALEAGLVQCHEGETKLFWMLCRIHQNKSSCKRRKGNRCNSYKRTCIHYKDNLTVNIDGVDIPYTISFGGSFFALVDTTKLDIGEINAKTVPAYTELGIKIRDKVNAES